MQTLRGRLILSHILPVLMVVPLVAVVLIYLLETQVLLTGLSHDIQQRARLAAEAVRQQAAALDDPGQAQALVARLAILADGRLVLLRPDGSTLADSALADSGQPGAGGETQASPVVGAPAQRSSPQRSSPRRSSPRWWARRAGWWRGMGCLRWGPRPTSRSETSTSSSWGS